MSQNTTAMQRGAGGETTGATDMTTQQPGFSMSQYASSKDLFAAMIARITDLEAQLEAIGAGGVSGPLIGQPQAMPDLSQLTERGAKAWAGVDAQGLREGFTAADMATVSAQGFRDGVASVSAGSESMASYAIRLLVAAALITQAKADEALRLAAELTAAHGPADGESNELC